MLSAKFNFRSMSGRNKCKTNPFTFIDWHQEDAMVTKIDKLAPIQDAMIGELAKQQKEKLNV